jgi:hypothetical protein
MYSTIDEAWNNNPMAFITKKINAGDFVNNQHPSIISDNKKNFDIENISGNILDDVTNDNYYSFSDLNNLSDGYTPKNPIKNKHKYSDNKNNFLDRKKVRFSSNKNTMSDLFDSELFQNNVSETSNISDSDHSDDNSCIVTIKSMRHLKKCMKCQKKFKRKIKDYIEMHQMKQFYKNKINDKQSHQITNFENILSTSNKDIIIIILSGVLILFIIYFIIQAIKK